MEILREAGPFGPVTWGDGLKAAPPAADPAAAARILDLEQQLAAQAAALEQERQRTAQLQQAGLRISPDVAT